ncbi:MAG: ABC transporter substrate-binding protein [bacterium]
MRRSVLAIVALLVGVVCLLGATPSLAVKYNEAPMLKELVAAGKLPPLEERLPQTPKVVVEGVELPKKDIKLEIGRYGGTLRTVHPAPNWNALLFIMNNEPLVNAPGVGVREPGVIWPNIVKDYKVSDNAKVFTFYMREGMKWSDGTPVTTEDVQFAFEDVILNERLTPVFPQWLKSANKVGGEPMKLEIVDKYTFRISFAEPYGGFLTQLALVNWRGYTDLLKPKHYLKQFHIRYTPLEKLEPLIKEQKLSEGEWWTLFNQKDITNWEFMQPGSVGFPVLTAWMTVRVAPTLTVLERNPYYFKVDSAGNQLPYIDRLETELVQDVEMINMKVLAGEVDFVSYGAGGISMKNLSLYKENEKKGGYRVVLLGVHNTPTNVFLNLTHPDPVWRQVVRDVRFRKALNMGINREEIIDTVYFGFASLPTQIPSEYDPVKANKLLDEMGLDKRDAEGWRLGPDGKTFVIPFEVSKAADDIVPVTEMIVEYFKALGLKTTMKVIDTGLWGTRNSANDLKAHVTWNATLTMWWQIWGMLPSVGWGPLWNQWFVSGGKEGEEPPGEAKRFVDLINRSVAVTPQSEERQRAIDEYLGLLYENLYVMPTAIDVKAPLIVAQNMGNVAHDGFAIASYYAGELFFYK